MWRTLGLFNKKLVVFISAMMVGQITQLALIRRFGQEDFQNGTLFRSGLK